MEAALVKRERFLLQREVFVDEKFAKIIASFLPIVSGESVIHLFCFDCFFVAIVYTLSFQNRLGLICLTSRQAETSEINPTVILE